MPPHRKRGWELEAAAPHEGRCVAWGRGRRGGRRRFLRLPCSRTLSAPAVRPRGRRGGGRERGRRVGARKTQTSPPLPRSRPRCLKACEDKEAAAGQRCRAWIMEYRRAAGGRWCAGSRGGGGRCRWCGRGGGAEAAGGVGSEEERGNASRDAKFVCSS